MKVKLVIIAALFAIIFGSCGSSNKTSLYTPPIQGEWLIEEAMGKSTATGEEQAFINFGTDGKINGSASVNNFFGEFTQKGKTLIFSAVGMTRRMGASMDIEDAITKAINETNMVKIQGNTATVLDKDGKTLMILKKK